MVFEASHEDIILRAQGARIVSKESIAALESHIARSRPGSARVLVNHSPSATENGGSPPAAPRKRWPQSESPPPYGELYDPTPCPPFVDNDDPRSETEMRETWDDAHETADEGCFSLSRSIQDDADKIMQDYDEPELAADVGTEPAISQMGAVARADDPNLAALTACVEQMGDPTLTLLARQRVAHALATDLAAATYSCDSLQLCSPVQTLLELAAVDDSSLTMQLVLSCITNLATKASSIVAAACPAVPQLLDRAIRRGQEDLALRSYALTAAYNLASEHAVMTELAQTGAAVVIRSFLPELFAGGDEHKFATEVLRQLRRAAPSRPSSATRMLSRVSSFSRSRGSLHK